MASRKASGITWNISVNSAGARTQISLLKRQIREANREWRNQSNSLVANGRYTDALKVKEQGLVHVQELLKSAIGKTDTMLNHSSADSGTRKYQQTKVDVEGFKDQLAKTGTQLSTNERKLELHNDALRNTSRDEQNAREIGKSRVAELQAEGRETEASAAKYRSYGDQLQILKRREEALNSTINRGQRDGLDQFGSGDFSKLIAQLHKVRATESELQEKQNDLGSGLTHDAQYNDLYNQSTNKVIASLKHLRQSTEANRVEYQRLSSNISNESNVLNLEAQKANKIAEVSGKDSIAFQREQSKLSSLSTTYHEHQDRINTLGSTYERMSSQVAASIDKRKEKIHELDSASHSELSTAHSLAGASFALGSGFIYGAKQAMGLENEFNRVKNLLNTSGESMHQADGEIKQMGRDTQQMSVQYGVSQKEIANGYEALARRGYTGKQALASQKYYLQGTIASGDKYNDVMHTAASTLEAFNMRSNKTGTMVGNTKKVVNQLAYAADLTATDFKGIGYGMQYVGDTAHNAHQSLSETSSALGVLSNRGENATVAATGLRKILLALSTIKNSKNKGALSKIGLSPNQLYDSKGNLKSLSDVFDILNSHMKNMSSTQKSTVFKSLFGTTGINSAFALSQSTGQLKSLNKQVAKSQDQSKGQGYVAKIARRNMNSTQMQMKRLKEAGTLLAQTYAQGLNPVFKRFAGLGLSAVKVFNKLPKSLKDTIAIGTTIVPVLTSISFALAAIHKSYAVFAGIHQKGLLSWIKESNEIKDNNNELSTHTSKVNADNAAKEKQNELAQQGKNNEDSQNNSINENTAANNDNATSTDKNSATKTNNAKLETTDADATKTDTEAEESQSRISQGSGLLTTAETGARLHAKGAMIAGGLTAGTEAASGDVKGGVEDGAGVTGGTMAGGALGATLGSVIPGAGTAAGGKIGSAIGSIAGPIAARGIGDAVGPVVKGINRKIQSNPNQQKNNKTNDKWVQQHTRELEHERQAENRELGAQSSLGGILGRTATSTQTFVKSEATDERKAEANYVRHKGKMTEAQHGYFNDMYNRAADYEKRRTKQKESELKDLYKKGDISKKYYDSDLKYLKQSETNKLKTLKKDENNVLKESTKGRKARLKALQKFNSDITKETNASSKKQLRLKRYLDNHEGKLDQKSYDKIMNSSKHAYRSTVNDAKREYNTKRSAAEKEYHATLREGRDKLHLKGSQYRELERKAAEHKNKQIENASNQESKTESHARNQKNKVVDAANGQASSAIKSAYREKNSTGSIFSRMASSIGSLFHNISFAASHVHIHQRANGTPDTQALHFALGNLPGIAKDENAVINDGNGRELVKLPNGQFVLPSGRNVHTILPKGTSVFNADQTHKLLNTIGAINSPVQHHASGTVGTLGIAGLATGSNDSKKRGFNISSMKGNVRDARKAARDIHDVVDKSYQDTSDDANKHLQDLHDNSDSLWDDTRKLTKKHVTNIHDDTKNRTKNLRDIVDKFEKQTESWSNSHLGTTVKYFKKHFNMIPPITRESMKSGVSNINAGIGAIDRVLSEFGGNSHVLSSVHYAAGTSTPPTRKQLAYVNDATSGPTQEAIVSDTGKVRMPHGKNVLTALNPGDRVLNGNDTLRALKSGIIPHYAEGKQSGEALYKLAEHYARYPSNFINGTLNNYTSLIGDNLTRGITNAEKQGSQEPADNWSNAMWKYINSIINASSSAFLKYAEQFGTEVHYVYGANGGNNAYDCSSFVDACLRHFGVGDLPRTSNAIISHFQPISRDQARPGDLLGTSEHIGIVADNGANSYYSNHGPEGHHPAASTTPYEAGAFPGGAAKFARVPQLAQYNSDSSVNNNPLTPVVKSELGSNAIEWIKDHVSNDMDMANPSGDTVQRWIPAVKQALSKLNLSTSESTVSRVLRQIQTESSGNPYAVGGTDGLNEGHAMGLMQVKPGTFSEYGDSKLGSWHNGYASIYAGLNYAKHRYGDSLSFLGEGHGYANGGLSVGDKIAHISEGNRPEMVLPLTDKSRAVELMLKSLQYMFGNDKGNNQQNNQQSNEDRKFEHDLVRSNRQKDFEINNLVHTTQHILDKMTLLIRTVQQKPVISDADIYKANRSVNMRKLRLRNFNRGTF